MGEKWTNPDENTDEGMWKQSSRNCSFETRYVVYVVNVNLTPSFNICLNTIQVFNSVHNGDVDEENSVAFFRRFAYH